MTLNRALAPESVEIKAFKITRAISTQLTNKVPLHYIKLGSQNLIKMDIIFDAGNYSESKKGQSFFTSKMLSEGTLQLSQKEIADKIAFYGAQIEFFSGVDKITITITVLEKHIYSLFYLLNQIICESVFPEKNFLRVKDIYYQQLKINNEKTSFVAGGIFKQSIFGPNHPYGYFITEEDLANLTLKDCQSFYKSYIKDNAFEIIISGNSNDDLLKEIDKQFGHKKHKISSLQTSNKDIRIEQNSNEISINKEESVQSSLRIGKRMFTRKHPDYFKFTFLNEVLGGYFGSRLMKTIREEKGLTYSIYSQIATHIHEGYFVIGADVKKELLTEAVEDIFAQIEILKNELIPIEELETVKSYMIGTYLGSVNTAFALADKFKIIHYNELNYSYYDNYITNIKKITANDLQQLAQKYFDVSSFVKVFVG